MSDDDVIPVRESTLHRWLDGRDDAREEVERLRWALLQSEVPSHLYSGMAIAVARAHGQLRVDQDGRGWVRGIVPDRVDEARAIAEEGTDDETD